MEKNESREECATVVEPAKEHEWLRKLVGKWTYEGKAVMGEGKPMEKFTGVEHVRPLGSLWILAEACGEMPGGGNASMITTLGFDVQKGRFVGTWVGSMMTHLWVYDGELDEEDKTLTLESLGPDMSSGTPGKAKLTKFKDVMTIKDEDRRTVASYMLDAGGDWTQMMACEYRREK